MPDPESDAIGDLFYRVVKECEEEGALGCVVVKGVARVRRMNSEQQLLRMVVRLVRDPGGLGGTVQLLEPPSAPDSLLKVQQSSWPAGARLPLGQCCGHRLQQLHAPLQVLTSQGNRQHLLLLAITQ